MNFCCILCAQRFIICYFCVYLVRQDEVFLSMFPFFFLQSCLVLRWNLYVYFCWGRFLLRWTVTYLYVKQLTLSTSTFTFFIRKYKNKASEARNRHIVHWNVEFYKIPPKQPYTLSINWKNNWQFLMRQQQWTKKTHQTTQYSILDASASTLHILSISTSKLCICIFMRTCFCCVANVLK